MIKFNNASFTYKSKERQGGVFNISLSIEEGEFVLLTGESGCGKTTLTRLINGLSPEYYTGDLQGEVELSLIHISEPTRLIIRSRMPSSA